MSAFETDTAVNRGRHCNIFQYPNTIVFVIFHLCYLTFCIKEVINDKIFWKKKSKLSTYKEATGCSRVIPCKCLNNLSNCICFVSFFIVLLSESKSLSKVRYFIIKQICRPLRHIKPETEKSLEFFFRTLIQLYLVYIFLYSFNLQYQKFYQR